jgi:hypothetical protein
MELTILTEVVDGGSSRRQTATSHLDHSLRLSSETLIFPIQKRNDPRVFRLSASVNLQGLDESAVTRMLLTPFASWTTRAAPRENL